MIRCRELEHENAQLKAELLALKGDPDRLKKAGASWGQKAKPMSKAMKQLADAAEMEMKMRVNRGKPGWGVVRRFH